MRPRPSVQRSPERIGFLTDVLTTAIENGGYGWFAVEEYQWEDTEDPHALIVAQDDDKRYYVNLDVISSGLRKIRERWTGQPNYGGLREADRTNGEEGDYDVFDALAVIEYALFGKVTYS